MPAGADEGRKSLKNTFLSRAVVAAPLVLVFLVGLLVGRWTAPHGGRFSNGEVITTYSFHDATRGSDYFALARIRGTNHLVRLTPDCSRWIRPGSILTDKCAGAVPLD